MVHSQAASFLPMPRCISIAEMGSRGISCGGQLTDTDVLIEVSKFSRSPESTRERTDVLTGLSSACSPGAERRRAYLRGEHT